jgi:hypothetical protein
MCYYEEHMQTWRPGIATPDFLLVDVTGFIVSVWITAVMFKANDLLRKQTALKVSSKFSNCHLKLVQ